ncbi:MAG: tRNA (adenosine(37)-N6)-dimethylallyltransferase MiaA [Proteobacteria bacterium]|nr:tRNA (adenosine(37)-N6)-dimethylallyltransferase MiaA [Pseudomonadota bacterium]
METPIRIVAVIGPTASGKTEIGFNLARKIGGEIVSVDSMQIYRWMDIGTAKPSLEMRSAVPHHLIDILDPDESYNAGKFVTDADHVIHTLERKKKPAILLGGTNLYLKSLIHGIIPVPEISTDVKRQVQKLLEEEGVAGCYQKLDQLDAKSAESLHANDVSRISRALEVVLETGKSIRDFQHQHRFHQQRYDVFFIGTHWPRETLYQRINQRVLNMVEEGLVEEAENLLWRGYSTDLPPLKSIGYKQAFLFLNNQLDHDEMIADIQQKSRHYAKKQITWYKKDQRIHWIDTNEMTDKTYTEVMGHLNRL